MFLLGVMLVALALLFFLTALALRMAGFVRQPYAVAGGLVVALAVGLLLLEA